MMRKDPIFRPAVGETFFVSEPEVKKIPLDKLVLVFSILLLLLGLSLLIRWLLTRRKRRLKEERDRRRKSDMKRLREALGLYQRLNRRYPSAAEGEFDKILNSLEPPLAGLFEDYHYENLESNTLRYRLWCMLEDKNDPEAIDGLYELM